jgi:hypothetical protein
MMNASLLGIETAETANPVGGSTEDSTKLAEREVAHADELLLQWEAVQWRTSHCRFDLTVQPAIGGEEAAITLKGIISNMSVSKLRDRVHAEMESKPQPDEQQLFIVDGDKGPLEDETLPVGAYGVVPWAGVTLHLALRDGQSAVRRREARSQVRARLRAEAEEAERARERAECKQRERERKHKKAVNAFITSVAAILVTLLITSPLTAGAYFSRGCGACKNDAACGGSLWGECICTGNHLGTYCEHSCGEFGQVDGSICVCSDSHTGTFCELDAFGTKYGEESPSASALTATRARSASWTLLGQSTARSPRRRVCHHRGWSLPALFLPLLVGASLRAFIFKWTWISWV